MTKLTHPNLSLLSWIINYGTRDTYVVPAVIGFTGEEAWKFAVALGLHATDIHFTITGNDQYGRAITFRDPRARFEMQPIPSILTIGNELATAQRWKAIMVTCYGKFTLTLVGTLDTPETVSKLREAGFVEISRE